MAILVTPIVGLFSFAAGGAAIRAALGDNAGVDTISLIAECLSGLIGIALTIFIFAKLSIAVKPLPDEAKPSNSSGNQ